MVVSCGWIIDREPNECYYMMLAEANQEGLNMIWLLKARFPERRSPFSGLTAGETVSG